MIILNKRRHYLFSQLVFLFAVLMLVACSNEEQVESRERETAVAVEKSVEFPEESAAPIETRPEFPEETPAEVVTSPDPTEEEVERVEKRNGADETDISIDEYRVVLGVDEVIKMPGIPGELRVWIGSPAFQANFPDSMIQDEASVPAVGESAKVQPFAPAFKIETNETECIKIHPSGSEVRFKLIPQKPGTFTVGANVFLFDSPDCSGSPIPKTAATLTVLVEVNRKDIFIDKVLELGDVFWEKFVEFWAALVAICFGLILFLIRGKLKKWFGFEE